MPGSLHGEHATEPTSYCHLRMVLVFWVIWGHPHALCWPRTFPPYWGILEPGVLKLVGLQNLPLQAVTNPCNWPVPFCLPRRVAWIHQPQCSDYLQRLPIAWSLTGLETGSSSPKVLCCAGLQPWTIFGDGCMTTYDFLTASSSLIAFGHGWWSSSIFYLIFEEGCRCQCLPVGISGHS